MAGGIAADMGLLGFAYGCGAATVGALWVAVRALQGTKLRIERISCGNLAGLIQVSLLIPFGSSNIDVYGRTWPAQKRSLGKKWFCAIEQSSNGLFWIMSVMVAIPFGESAKILSFELKIERKKKQ